MTMNGDGPPDDALRQSRMATEALASDMARSVIEVSGGEGENQVGFIAGQLTRLYVAIAELRAANSVLQEKLQAATATAAPSSEAVPQEDTEVLHPS